MLYEVDGQQAFRIDLYDHTVAHKWKDLIRSIYVGDGEDMDHIRTFFYLRTNDDIKKILVDAINNINNFLKTTFISLPNKIDWNDQKLYNDLHEAFEKLSGQYDNPTKLMKIAPLQIKENIRDLNYCVHYLEHTAQNITKQLIPIQWTKKRNETERIKLLDEEYDLIKFNMVKNEVYLAYNEVGKSYIDLWRDDLPVDYDATKNNHYIGPDINIALSDNENIFAPGFLTWCEQHGIDAYDKKHGIGVIPIGKIKLINIEHLTKDSKIDIIRGVK